MEESQTAPVPGKKQIPGFVWGIGIIVLVAAAYFGLRSRTEPEPLMAKPTGTIQPASPGPTSGTSAATVTQVKTYNVEAGSYYYKPEEMRVKVGDRVKIVLNSVSMMHDFNIDELNVHMPIVKNGNSGTIEFVADQKGTFEYYCSVGSHRQLGQVGKLIVE